MNNSNTKNLISNQRRIFEIIAVVFTGVGKFIFMDLLNYRFPFILISIIGWATYIWIRKKNVKGILYYWGFRADNFKQVMQMVLPFGLASIIVFVVVGWFQQSLNISWHIIPVLIIYPLWGLIQQFLVIGLVAGNLQDLDNFPITNIVIILLTALLFGLIHYPNYWLILGTFILALFYGYIYLRSRNLYILGIFHGWLGGLFYYTVVNQDPFINVFGKYFNM